MVNTVNTAPPSSPWLAPAWPYPFWIAHRGAGKHAPENTLAAIRLGAAQGYRMFECDVKLSLDSVAYLLHDDGLERTTNASAQGALPIQSAKLWPWQDLAALDAGAWHSAAYRDERLPRLEEVAALCAELQILVNLEIKPCPGTAFQTGCEVARLAQQLWQRSDTRLANLPPPLLSSFEVDALKGARECAPNLPRALLSENVNEAVLAAATSLGCVALVLDYPVWSGDWLVRCHELGLRALCYTVNDSQAAEALMAMGIDGIITDEVVKFNPHKTAQGTPR